MHKALGQHGHSGLTNKAKPLATKPVHKHVVIPITM